MQKAKKIFITATNTDIGKTYTTLKLIQNFIQEGKRVLALKPIETGVEDVFHDGSKLLAAIQTQKDFKNLTVEDIVPIHFSLPAAPFVANDCQEIDLEPIFLQIEKFESMCDVLLIEGAGGLYVPINKEYFMIDLIADLAVDETILVTHCDLGCINDTLLSYKALEAKNLQPKLYFNCKNSTKEFEKISQPYFDAINLKGVR